MKSVEGSHINIVSYNEIEYNRGSIDSNLQRMYGKIWERNRL